MDETGNRGSNNNLLNMYSALKDNIMRTLNVCEICRVISSVNLNYYKVQILNKPETFIEAYSTIDNLVENDLVIVIFTNYDTRQNLERALQGQYNQLITVPTSETKHSLDFGIIINKLN